MAGGAPYRNGAPLQHGAQYGAMELPAQVNVGDNANGPANTQFRHELLAPAQSPYTHPIHQRQWGRFSIPTKSPSLSSGFPFDQRLYNLQISDEQWYQFSQELLSAAKLTFKEDAAAWTTGVTTGAVGSTFLLVFGPWAGYAAGKAVHKKTVVKKVKERLLQGGEIKGVLQKWNEGMFGERGFHAWLEVPSEEGGRDEKRFRIVIIQNTMVPPPHQQSPTSPPLPGQNWTLQQNQNAQFQKPPVEGQNWTPPQNQHSQFQKPPDIINHPQVSELPNQQPRPNSPSELSSTPASNPIPSQPQAFELDAGLVQAAR